MLQFVTIYRNGLAPEQGKLRGHSFENLGKNKPNFFHFEESSKR